MSNPPLTQAEKDALNAQMTANNGQMLKDVSAAIGPYFKATGYNPLPNPSPTISTIYIEFITPFLRGVQSLSIVTLAKYQDFMNASDKTLYFTLPSSVSGQPGIQLGAGVYTD